MVEAKSQVEALEADIREIIQRLLELEVTPHIRELRAKAVTYGRVIGGWAIYPPTPPQLQAMTECVMELQRKVHGSQRPTSGRAPSKHAPTKTLASHRVGPGSVGPGVSKSGVPPVDADLFAAALHSDEVENTGVRTRGMRPPAPTIPSDPPMHMPTPDTTNDYVPSVRPRRGASIAPSMPTKAATIAPASRKRPASDTRPTPVPALLQTRRSR